MRTLGGEELLRQLPVLQRLLSRLVDCKPTGGAAQDHVVQVFQCPDCFGFASRFIKLLQRLDPRCTYAEPVRSCVLIFNSLTSAVSFFTIL